MQKHTTLPSAVALHCPEWASEATKALSADAVELFDTTRQARAEAERLNDAAGTIDLMATSVSDLAGAGGMARQAQIEALRDELLARSRFSEFLDSLESDRARALTEAAEAVDQARADAKAALLGAGVPDLSEAVTTHGRPDDAARAAWSLIVCSFPAVGQAAGMHREARSLGSSLAGRVSDNRRHRSETETALRKMLTSLAAAAVG